MQKLGGAIATVCKPDWIIYLCGELGTGKTTLVRGFLRKLGWHGAVRSPTFTLLEPYKFNDMSIYHFDLYRLMHAEEFIYIGGRDCFTEQSICLVEWPERGKGFLPEADLFCSFDFSAKGKERKVQLIAKSSRDKKIINTLNYGDIEV